MANPGDIIRCTHFYTYLTQEVLNVFFWKIGAGSESDLSLFTLSDDYLIQFQGLVLDNLSDSLVLNRILWENLTDGVEIVDFATTAAGAVGGEPMPSSVALGVILRRTNKITRNGYKRFAGLAETQVAGNLQLLSTPVKDNIESFCGVIRNYPDYDGAGGLVVLEPVIVGRTLDAGGNYEIDLSKVNPVITAQVKANVSTQNTRKP